MTREEFLGGIQSTKIINVNAIPENEFVLKIQSAPFEAQTKMGKTVFISVMYKGELVNLACNTVLSNVLINAFNNGKLKIGDTIKVIRTGKLKRAVAYAVYKITQ
jgi:ribosomal protein S17